MATVSGNSQNSSFLTDSQPSSENAITSQLFMHFDASAPAPPTAQKYTEPLRTIALQTSSERGPLPIIAPRPISKSFGEKTSILLEVVGPQLPIANPFGVGVGPAKYCTAPFIS